MENDFEHIESEYESFKSSFEGYIFDILYNISNFFDEYETFVMEASCVCSDYVFSTEKSKTKYQGIASKCEDMKDESISNQFKNQVEDLVIVRKEQLIVLK